MRFEKSFRVPAAAGSVREGLRLYLLGAGFVEAGGEGDLVLFSRGSRFGRCVSMKIETWPTVLRVILYAVSNEETGVGVRFDVDTGLHLVGALDRAVLEAEAAEMQAYLASGERAVMRAALDGLRRPVQVAAITNMVVVTGLVVFVGLLGRYHFGWVALVAFAVALLDGVVILSFADLVYESSRRFHAELADAEGRAPPAEPGDPDP